MEFYEVLLPLAAIIFLAKMLSMGCRKLGLPQVIGLLVTGVLLGLVTLIPNQQFITDTSVTVEADHELNENCINQVMAAFNEMECSVFSVNSEKLDLEDIFLKLTGTKLRDQGG